jgi:hypothetical protein
VVHEWLDTWRGIGDVTRGMTLQGWDLRLTEYDAGEHWRATFFIASEAHSIMGGSAWEKTPWRAAQRAPWETLTKAEAQATSPAALSVSAAFDGSAKTSGASRSSTTL